MKHKIKLTVIGLAAIGFILRFVSIDVPVQDQQRPMMKCSQVGAPQFDEDGFEIISKDPPCKDLEEINHAYMKEIKPILEAKCLMCHGNVKKMPLYSKVPPISWLVEHDIAEAKKHMDMTYGFPFAGHGGPKEDLRALAKVVKKGSMPPVQYKIMHWQSSLSEKEKMILLEWVQENHKRLTLMSR